MRLKLPRLLIPTTWADVWRRSSIRLGCCSVPYLALAWFWSLYRDDRLFHGFVFWTCVILIPGLGLVLDFWRLTQVRNDEKPTA